MTIFNCCTMVRSIFLFSIVFLLSCSGEKEEEVHQNDWSTRKATFQPGDSLETGTTYLSVYSSVYSFTEKSTTNLTATVSLRNTDLDNQIYVQDAKYYNTQGDLIRTYFDEAIFIDPLETVEIVIYQYDEEGGTGGNFIFNWSKAPKTCEPMFEAVMISTSGQQGLSFSTQGKRIK